MSAHSKIIATIVSAWAIAASSLISQAQNTQKLSANKSNEYGLIYSLPLTGLDVTIEAKLDKETPGEYYRYARKYLSLDPITQPKEVWTIKSITLATHAVADPKERYLVQFKSGTAPFMIIDDNQFPISINTEERFTPKQPQLPKAVAMKPTILDLPVARQAMTEDMIRSTSLEKKAQLAAARIFELRENRSDLLSGESEMANDGAAVKLVLENIGAQEQALTAMFVGTKQQMTDVKSYSLLPDSTDRQQIVIARLSPTLGLLPADDLRGNPIYLNIDVTNRGTLPINEKGEYKKYPKGGLAYRIPGTARISVSYEGNTIATEEIKMSQFGTVFGLDPSIFTDKKAPSAAIFNPTNGAIVELKPITPAQ